MTSFVRWAKFNVVGAAGMAVQLAALALFNRLLHGRYLIVSAAALELTLLHNFVWHTQYTWRDRRDGVSRRQQLLRFHLSNGLVSLAGNLALMRLLVHAAHLPLLLDNAIAILCCSAANFWFSHRWTFSESRCTLPVNQPPSRTAAVAPLLALPVFALLTCPEAHAQLPNAASIDLQKTPPASLSSPPPAAVLAHRRSILTNYAYYVATFCATGASTSQAATVPAMACGAGTAFPIAPLFLEAGVMGPQANRSFVSAYLSADARFPVARFRAGYAPFAIIGYSRLFETGHALDYGIGMETPRFGGARGDASKALLFELRDYWTFANPSQHNVMLRIGWVLGIPD